MYNHLRGKIIDFHQIKRNDVKPDPFEKKVSIQIFKKSKLNEIRGKYFTIKNSEKATKFS